MSAQPDPTRIDTLTSALSALGADGRHAQFLLRTWAQALPLSRGPRRPEHFLPRRVREAWPAWATALDALATLQSAHPDPDDGSERLLVRLHDGQTVEAVLLPRGGLCISTQVGCAVGCVFCMTGTMGLLRQMGSAELVAQLALARRRRAVDKVVFMGMGEPAHNLDAVMAAIELMGTAGAIAHKNLVFSTVGDPRVFERLPRGPVKPALALSLHTTDDALRARLLPRAPRIAVRDLIEAADGYARATGYPVQVQWTLLDGVNDHDGEIEALIGLLRGRRAMLNLIPMNRVETLPYGRPPAERAVEMARRLNRGGVLTRLRQSAGQTVDGGCGQLRSRVVPIQASTAAAHPNVSS